MFIYEHSGSIIYQVMDNFPHDLSGLRAFPAMPPRSLALSWSHDLGCCHLPTFACPPGCPNCQLLLWFLLGLSHALDNPSSKFEIVPSWTTDLHMLLHATVFVSACRLLVYALLNLHLCCWMSTTTPVLVSLSPNNFSYLAWTVHHSTHVRQQSALSIILD